MGTRKINFSALSNARSMDEIQQIINEILDEYSLDDPPYMSDILTYYQRGGSFLQERLGAMWENRRGPQYKWKIKVMSDEFGRPVNPGDKIIRKIPRNGGRDNNGNLISQEARREAMRSGTEDEDYNDLIAFEVDDKGCIECEFDDCVGFLNTHGVHGRSGRPLPMNTHLKTSKEPVKVDGGHLHVHYWRYKEVDNEQYEALPSLVADTETDDKPKATRTRKKATK